MSKKSFRLDLTEIGGEGDFPCPKCGNLISPDDETDNEYTVIDTVGDDDYLESMVIQCNRCNSTITLEGFDVLSEGEDSNVIISEALSGSELGTKTYHEICVDNLAICKLTVQYAKKEDVAAFKRLRKLHVGEPFNGTITIENMEINESKHETFQKIIKAVKKKFKKLRDRDIYLVELKDGKKNFVARASNLQLGSFQET